MVLNGSFFGLVHNLFTLKRLNKEASLADKEYQQLNEEYLKILSGDNSYIEDAARVKYHMSKKDEIEFRIKK